MKANNNYQGNIIEKRLKEIDSRLSRLYKLRSWTSGNPAEVTDEFDSLIQEFERERDFLTRGGVDYGH